MAVLKNASVGQGATGSLAFSSTWAAVLLMQR